MGTKTKKRQKSKIAPIRVRGMNKEHTYSRARLRTPTGERLEVACVDFQNEDVESMLLEDNSFNPDLRLDLERAMVALFTPLQRRVLSRVLVQGKSVRQATERMKGSNDVWERWIAKVALPALRERLSAWKEELSRLGTNYVPTLGAPVEEPPTERVKCRHCRLKFVGKRAFSQLRAHVNDDHPIQAAQVNKYVTRDDYFLRRDELALQESEHDTL